MNDIMSSSKQLQNDSGYLEIIFGPMFSGKTTQTIQIYNKYKYIGKKVFVINYAGDTRYDDTMLSSHDEIKIPCVFVEHLSVLWDKNNQLLCNEMKIDSMNLKKADVVIINEGQFFPDIFEIVLEMVEKYKKKVFICGLDGDYKRRKFGNLLDLIPFSDKITKLNSLCSQCKNGNPAIFTHRCSKEHEQIVIGVDNYKPLCRECYLSMEKE